MGGRLERRKDPPRSVTAGLHSENKRTLRVVKQEAVIRLDRHFLAKLGTRERRAVLQVLVQKQSNPENKPELGQCSREAHGGKTNRTS